MSNSLSQGSDRTCQSTPLPASLELCPPSGERFVPKEVLTLPKPPSSPHSAPSAPPMFSVLIGNPHSPAAMSRGSKLALIDVAGVRNVAAAAINGEPGASQRFLASLSSLSSVFVPAAPQPALRPKHNLKNNSSKIISQFYVSEQLARHWQSGDLRLTFVNLERELLLLDSDNGHVLAKIVFTTEWPLCFALSAHTASPDQFDMLVGLSSGDLVWIELCSQRYQRVNKVAKISNTPITAVTYLPQSSSLVLAAHVDGSVVLYDLQGEDVPVKVPPGGNLSLNESFAAHRHFSIKAVYRLSRKQITQLLFVSKSQFIAACKTDYLVLFDMERETGTDLLPTLFGGIYCLAQSPDGRYLAAGGEDDVIHVFDLASSELELAARFVGHKAYVRAIAFDYFLSPALSGAYRLASVGEDGIVNIWDFAPDTLSQPKLPPNANASAELAWAAKSHPFKNTTTEVHGRVPQFAAKSVMPAARVYVGLSQFGESRLSDVRFTAEGLTVASRDGRLWKWTRAALPI